MSEATFHVATTYPDSSDPGIVPVVLAPHPNVTRATYTHQSLDVAVLADGSTAGQEIVIDFGSVVTEATGFTLKNTTGQDLALAFNGAVLTSAADTFETAASTFETAAGALETATSTFETAAGALETATSTFETAAGALETATSTFETAAGALETATTAYQSAVATQLATITGFTGSDDATVIVAAIADAATALGIAGTTLNTAKTTFDTAATTLDTAKTTFDTAATTLDTAKSTFDTAKTALDTAKMTFDTAKTTFDAAFVAFDAAKAGAVFTMPDGAVLSYATPAGATTPITSISLFATGTQTGNGEIPFKVFGA